MKINFASLVCISLLVNFFLVVDGHAKRKGCQPGGDCIDGFGDMYYTDPLRNGDRYAGQYRGGEREGFGTYYWWGNKKGQIMESDWADDQPIGDVLVTYADGSRYKGGWKMPNGREGVGKHVLKDGSYWLSEWSNDEKQGYAIFYDMFGDVREETFYHGKIGSSKLMLIDLSVFEKKSHSHVVVKIEEPNKNNDKNNKNKNADEEAALSKSEEKKIKAFFQSP